MSELVDTSVVGGRVGVVGMVGLSNSSYRYNIRASASHLMQQQVVLHAVVALMVP